MMDKLTHLLLLGFLVLATARHYDDGKATVVRILQRYESFSRCYLNYLMEILKNQRKFDEGGISFQYGSSF